MGTVMIDISSILSAPQDKIIISGQLRNPEGLNSFQIQIVIGYCKLIILFRRHIKVHSKQILLQFIKVELRIILLKEYIFYKKMIEIKDPL